MDVAALVAACDGLVRSTHKQRQTTHRYRLCRNDASRIVRHHNPYARRMRGSGEAANEIACAWPKRNRRTRQKLTRPDGEIRAGRVDRRRGSGGRERRSGLEFRPCRAVRLLVSASRRKVQADFCGSGGNFLPPLSASAAALLGEMGAISAYYWLAARITGPLAPLPRQRPRWDRPERSRNWGATPSGA